MIILSEVHSFMGTMAQLWAIDTKDQEAEREDEE